MHIENFLCRLSYSFSLVMLLQQFAELKQSLSPLLLESKTFFVVACVSHAALCPECFRYQLKGCGIKRHICKLCEYDPFELLKLVVLGDA